MKITFLGTSHGVPSAERATSCSMIETGGRIYYIDAGAPIANRTMLAGADVTKARALFTTHAHSDHLADLFAFTDLMNWKYREVRFDAYLTEESVAECFRKLIALTTKPIDGERLRILSVDADFVYDDGNLRATFYPTGHLAPLGRPAYGILIEAEGKRVYFSGDLSQHLQADDFPRLPLEEEIDLFVCELAHFGLEHIGDRLGKLRARQVAFNHVSPIAKLDQLEALKGSYPFTLHVLKDMDVIEL